MLKVATDCTGIGSPEQALKNLGVEHEIVFACERDKYARSTYTANFKPGLIFEDMTTRDNSPKHLYSELYIAGIPCQSFSLIGKRLGELDKRGILFYNSYDYIQKQKPKAFIIENVTGLLTDNKGRTFKSWLELLSFTVNYQYNLHSHPDSLNYNIHYKVLNAVNFGSPQNRERIFIVGLRNDLPNTFLFPDFIPLNLKLKDLLEEHVSDKYYLSEKLIKYFTENNIKQIEAGNGFIFQTTDGNCIAKTITTKSGDRNTDNYIKDEKGIRKLTPLECFRLQGFKDEYLRPVSDRQLIKQAGNTINVNVIKAVLKNLIPLIQCTN